MHEGQWTELRLEVKAVEGALDLVIRKIEEALRAYPHTSIEVIPLQPPVHPDTLSLF